MQPAPNIPIFPMIMIFAIFYFLLIRPQKKSQGERERMIQGLAKNDEIVTTGGIHAKIINIKDKTLIVRIDENIKIEIDKSCVAYLPKNSKT